MTACVISVYKQPCCIWVVTFFVLKQCAIAFVPCTVYVAKLIILCDCHADFIVSLCQSDSAEVSLVKSGKPKESVLPNPMNVSRTSLALQDMRSARRVLSGCCSIEVLEVRQ
jgi:hypothetical protein